MRRRATRRWAMRQRAMRPADPAPTGEAHRVHGAPRAVALRGRLASESVDEAMTRALERWSKVGSYDRPAAWVYRVGLNWAVSRRRYLGMRPLRRSCELEKPVFDELPDVDLPARLASLRHEYRVAVVLRHFLEFTPTEIAEILDLPVGTVKSHIHRALAELRVRAQEHT